MYQDPAMESIHKNLKLLLLCYVLDSKTQESILSLLHKFKSKERTPLWRDLQSGSSPMLIELIDKRFTYMSKNLQISAYKKDLSAIMAVILKRSKSSQTLDSPYASHQE